MAFIDLQDAIPPKQGVYRVKIKSSTGKDRDCNATWSKRGFLPIEDKLYQDEYIYCWYKD